MTYRKTFPSLTYLLPIISILPLQAPKWKFILWSKLENRTYRIHTKSQIKLLKIFSIQCSPALPPAYMHTPHHWVAENKLEWGWREFYRMHDSKREWIICIMKNVILTMIQFINAWKGKKKELYYELFQNSEADSSENGEKSGSMKYKTYIFSVYKVW